jgi:hypothetical protein
MPVGVFAVDLELSDQPLGWVGEETGHGARVGGGPVALLLIGRCRGATSRTCSI